MLAAFFHFFGAFCFHLGLMLLPWIWHFFFNLNSIIFLFVLLPLLGLIDSVDFNCFSALLFNAFCSLLVDVFDAQGWGREGGGGNPLKSIGIN